MPPAQRRFRVMIVEDEALIAMTVAQYVASYGYEVVGPFGKVSQALSSLQEQPVDAAVLDVQLDREIVFPVAMELTARRIAFLTAHQPQAFPEQFKRTDRVSKPFRQAELKRALSKLIRNRPRAKSRKAD
jgi:DNA-binding response OmpR family regulator